MNPKSQRCNHTITAYLIYVREGYDNIKFCISQRGTYLYMDTHDKPTWYLLDIKLSFSNVKQRSKVIHKQH